MKPICGDLRRIHITEDLRIFISGAAIALFFCPLGLANESASPKPVTANKQEIQTEAVDPPSETSKRKADAEVASPDSDKAKLPPSSNPQEEVLAPGSHANFNVSSPRELRRNFRNLVSSQMQAFRHQKQIELRELEKRQSKLKQNWKIEQEIRRKKFYERVKEPIPRRQFEREEERKWQEYLTQLNREKFREKNEFARRRIELKKRQRIKEKQLEAYIKKGEHPPPSFW